MVNKDKGFCGDHVCEKGQWVTADGDCHTECPENHLAMKYENEAGSPHLDCANVTTE